MKAAGIDLGGTKIELQLFDDNWQVAARRRVATPQTYPELVSGVVDLIRWGDAKAGAALPVGIGAAGLVHPRSGLTLTANLCASGKPFPHDIMSALGRDVTYVNDCRALALSEAVFGAGRGHNSVMSLILGTGTGGGLAIGGKLLTGPTMTGGEYGHTSAPAHLIAAYGLPLFSCGCGRTACIETYVSGTGMRNIAKAVTGKDWTPPEIVAALSSDDAARKVWDIWSALTGDLIHTMTLTVDPDVIVLGGGLSQIDGVADTLMAAAKQAQFGEYDVAPIVLPQGGDTSGARGAAFAAFQEQTHV